MRLSFPTRRHVRGAAWPGAAWPRLALAIGLLAAGSARAGATVGSAAPASATRDSAVTREETEVHLLAAQTTSLRLAHRFVMPGSVTAVVGGVVWEAPDDFRLQADEGIWLPQRPLGAPEGGPVAVRLRYRFQPVPLPALRQLREPARPPAPAGAGGGPKVENVRAPGTVPAMAATGDLQVRGSKSVRLASGNRRELVVDQNLRLTIDGRLTPEIAVRAVLSDDNLPIVPEGNTEQLRDVDKVLVELEATQWRATLGDFVAKREGSTFGDYRRKLQGLQLAATPRPWRADALAGAPRGVYRTLQIRGEEANQGPYRLGGTEAGGNLYIVAGSERVMLDGEALVRGADRDYVVDYVLGTITFTYRRLITAESTIVVEFEQGEGPYARTVAGAGAGVDVVLPLSGQLPGSIDIRVARERDDPQRLRSGELTEEDRAALAEAGDDAAAAIASGIAETDPGEGDYRREADDLFVYDPQLGSYDLNFFFAGSGQGDYGLDSLTVTGTRVFSYRGAGQGSYRLGRLLPLPVEQAVTTVAARLGDSAQPHLAFEWNASRLDRNVFSPLADQDNSGVAWALRVATGEGGLRAGRSTLGRFSLEGSHENRDSRFRPFLLRRDVFAYDRWGLGARAGRDGFLDERDVESRACATWHAGEDRRRGRVAAEWGRLSHGAALRASRWSLDTAWRLGALEAASQWAGADATDARDPLDVRRNRQQHRLAWTTSFAQPAVRWEQDEWTDAARTAGIAAGSRLRRLTGALAAPAGSTWHWQAEFERSLADSSRQDGWARERDGRTWRLQLTPPSLGGVRLAGDGTLRQVRRDAGETQTTRLARLTAAAAWPRLGSDWSLGYGVDNSRAEVLDRQVVFVGTRLGDYNQDGLFVGIRQGDYSVVYAGTDSLVSTTEVSGDLTWRQDVAPLGRDRKWARASTLTHLTARGRSRETDVGRLLRLAPDALFDPEQAVLGEVAWQQDLNLLQGWRAVDLRLRWDYAQTRDRQYAAHPEDRIRRGWQTTFTRNLSETTTLQLRAADQQEERLTRAGLAGNESSYDADSWTWEAEWSARPGAGNRLALGAELIRRRDAVSGVAQDEWALRPSARWRLGPRWSGNLELRWASVESDEPDGVARPYFFPYPGANRDVTARAAWDPTPQLSVSASWYGRQRGEGGWQHDVRVESTARF